MYMSSLKQLTMIRAFFILCILAVWSATCQAEAPHSLWEILDYYGCKNTTQKTALQALLQKSGVSANELLMRPLRNDDEILSNILAFVKISQEKFTLRTGTQERWEVKPAPWMEANIIRNANELTALGMTSPRLPENKDTDVVCVLGATASRMQTRIDFASRLVRNRQLNTKFLVLLSGERYVSSKNSLDGTQQELDDLAKKLNKPADKLTETDLLLNIYQKSDLYQKYDTTILDVPRGDLPRPTTESTVNKFVQWLAEQPDIKSVTFVSNQPYIGYQQAIIELVFRQAGAWDKYKVDIVGPGYDLLKKPDVKQIVEVCSALGSQIYAQTPLVIQKLGLKVTEPQLRQSFVELYKQQPSIYAYSESLFGD